MLLGNVFPKSWTDNRQERQSRQDWIQLVQKLQSEIYNLQSEMGYLTTRGRRRRPLYPSIPLPLDPFPDDVRDNGPRSVTDDQRDHGLRCVSGDTLSSVPSDSPHDSGLNLPRS